MSVAQLLFTRLVQPPVVSIFSSIFLIIRSLIHHSLMSVLPNKQKCLNAAITLMKLRINWFVSNSFSPDPTERQNFWSLTLGAFVTFTSLFGINQAQIQRYNSLPSIQHVRKCVKDFHDSSHIKCIIFLVFIKGPCSSVSRCLLSSMWETTIWVQSFTPNTKTVTPSVLV